LNFGFWIKTANPKFKIQNSKSLSDDDKAFMGVIKSATQRLHP